MSFPNSHVEIVRANPVPFALLYIENMRGLPTGCCTVTIRSVGATLKRGWYSISSHA